MKKVLLGSVATIALGLASSAFAADLPARAPIYTKAPPPPALFSWTGFYIGGNVGGKWLSNTSGEVDIAPAPGLVPPGVFFPFTTSGSNNGTFMGGGQVGYNWQTGPVVFGLEGDIDAQHWSQTRTVAAPIPAPAVGFFIPGDSFTMDSKWQASLRGRIGYAWDRTLLYATGGVAWTNVRVGANFLPGFAPNGLPLPGTAGSDSFTFTGATVGGGIEYAAWNNISLGIEGRYTWYGSHTFNVGTVSVGPPVTFVPVSERVTLQTAEIMGKVNFRFGAW